MRKFNSDIVSLWRSTFLVVVGVCVFVFSGLSQTFNVLPSGNSAYIINGQVNPTLTLQRGVTYMFQVNAAGHPFFIKTVRGTGTGSAFNNGVTGNGVQTGTLTFAVPANAPNQLFYQCSLHFSMGGTINISNAANALPSVTITNPPNGAVFIAPASVSIQATASDTDGSITNVQILVGAAVLTDDSTAPYAATTNGLPSGNYTLSAIASDNNGGRATNSVSILVNAPPSIALTNPPNGTKLTAPATFSLGANASDTDGSVTNVQFFFGATQLGQDTTPPFTFAVNSLPAGNYAFSASATDNRGTLTTSSVVNVFILTNAILTSPQWINGQFRFTVTGIAGQTYISETSAGFSNWSAFSTNIAPADTFEVVDPNANSSNLRGYRVRQDL